MPRWNPVILRWCAAAAVVSGCALSRQSGAASDDPGLVSSGETGRESPPCSDCARSKLPEGDYEIRSLLRYRVASPSLLTEDFSGKRLGLLPGNDAVLSGDTSCSWCHSLSGSAVAWDLDAALHDSLPQVLGTQQVMELVPGVDAPERDSSRIEASVRVISIDPWFAQGRFRIREPLDFVLDEQVPNSLRSAVTRVGAAWSADLVVLAVWDSLAVLHTFGNGRYRLDALIALWDGHTGNLLYLGSWKVEASGKDSPPDRSWSRVLVSDMVRDIRILRDDPRHWLDQEPH